MNLRNRKSPVYAITITLLNITVMIIAVFVILNKGIEAKLYIAIALGLLALSSFINSIREFLGNEKKILGFYYICISLLIVSILAYGVINY